MNQAEFDKLPMLLRAGDVRRVLGLEKRAVVELRKARAAEGKPIATVLPGSTEYKFFKKEIAVLARLEYRWAQPEATVRDVIERLERIEKLVMSGK